MSNEVCLMANTKLLPPNVVIGGVPKAGTTALYDYLSKRDDFYFPVHKEPYFFSHHKQSLNHLNPYIRGLIINDIPKYNKLYNGSANGQFRGDASTCYLYHSKRVITNLHELVSKDSFPKFLFIIRNPVDRALSHYTYSAMKGIEKRSIQDAMFSPDASVRGGALDWDGDYVGASMYGERLRDFFNASISVKVVVFEELFNESTLKEIVEFFGAKWDGRKITATSNPSGVLNSKLLARFFFHDNWPKKIARNILSENQIAGLRRIKDNYLSSKLKKVKYADDLRQKLWLKFESDVRVVEELVGQDVYLRWRHM
jgi:hypothetical protein